MKKNRIINLLFCCSILLLFSCSSESETLTAKDILMERLQKGKWTIVKHKSVNYKPRLSKDYEFSFVSSNRAVVNNAKDITGQWSMYFANEIIYLDDLDEPAPDNENVHLYEDLEEEHLYMVLSFNSTLLEPINGRWRISGYNSKRIHLSRGDYKFTLQSLEAN